jgi:hypothetical protein
MEVGPTLLQRENVARVHFKADKLTSVWYEWVPIRVEEDQIIR